MDIQTEAKAFYELLKLCANYSGAALDPIEFLNQFDGLKLMELYMNGVLI